MRPPRGTAEHRTWLVARIREHLSAGGHRSRDAFVASAASKRDRVTSDDMQAAGGWAALVSAAQAVDVSGLDWDDVGDTKPHRFEVPDTEPAPRQPEPRELLDAQRAKAEAVELRRRLDDVLRELHAADTRAGVVDALRADVHEPRPVARRETSSGLREATPVVLCSDWHIEEVVRPEAVDGRNAYGPEIAGRRVRKLAESILWMLETHRSRFAIRDLVLWLGGDLISGWIHEELVETNALSPIEATLLAQELIADLLRTLLAESGLERIVLPCSYGNHGRATQKRRSKNGAATSYEWLVYHHLARTFTNESRLEFQIANGPHLYLKVYDWTLRFHHGDDVNYWGGTGGITIPIRKAITAWESFRRADLTCLGHFHSYHDLSDFVVNGSLVGYSEYALSVKARYEDARQAFFLIDSRRFKCMSTPLWVTEEPGASA